ncbi:putative signal transducing protein [Rufibacter glacialis]|uniref:DUF2007 domain-containing protein n=1 Tax=Rufibacter glacialis TaxID=1259555 RepID=A0A5M8QNZ4_9BACT|nr:DUF2007 domain-containing protein [Rufibacter glacialis]KAA6435892.1 DUF2007 domain-containing protein [Rufibacter glacialis]GGK67446.1 hypothetical protein GCM10011405_14310 [Rufibacter glacialis]
MADNFEPKPVIVFSGSAMEANVVKSMLENANIQAFLKDQHIGSIAPWQVSAGGGGAVKVIVSSLDQEEAQEIILRYEQNDQQ